MLLNIRVRDNLSQKNGASRVSVLGLAKGIICEMVSCLFC